MNNISKLISDLSSFNNSLNDLDSNEIKANIQSLNDHFPALTQDLGGLFKEELNKKGILNNDLAALLTPGVPTNIEPKPIVPNVTAMVSNTPAVPSFIIPDETEKSSLKEFRTAYKNNPTVPNIFVARNIEEDNEFIKCKCPRCKMSSFIIKNNL